jgi:hypothetical protein
VPARVLAERARLGRGELGELGWVWALYVVGELIPTQSGDVERGFSLLNHCLGLTRLKTSVITLDCRLRIKQNVPIEAGEYDIELTRVGVEAEKDSTEPNAVQYHKQLLLPNEPMLLVQQLHDVCKIEKCSLWDETLENAFQELDTVVEAQAIVDLASDEEIAEQRSGGEMSLEEMERLLSGL